ncbi:DUF1553 domain-containing protein [Limnoglobus roseus]|uniref:Cytochrome c n=1 Tax=Limnoglobus roseus TaxID=2598579 RepID=A0A5C1ACR3_9BACT|nr:DUF1553 domain-containing protein [Limnoglobus roseus]QEL14894.1 hypothetical protein PX52LOC_01795 [Limnoglobus roseus]
MRLPFLALCLFALPVRAADPPKPVDFARDVRPIFAKACASCHGSEKQKGGLRLDRKADALKGGDDGPAIVPKDSTKSPLIQRVTEPDADKVMPPKGEKLTAGEVAILRAWIDAGALWPDDGSAAVDARDWWSLRPLQASGIRRQESGNPIDSFVRAKLNERGLKPSPEADRRTLIRRVYFDLTGLPPTFEEVEAFAKDASPTAYESLVDKLLASPRYGERWARHWLDVVHYGETHGYDKDQPRPNAWPYRDYVIRAFNEDKPYARFVQEQIAGDVLFPGTTDGIEALGFLAAGPWDLIGHAEVPESKIDGKVARHLDRDDFVANTMGTFQSLTVHCAQCHNHKFDPISQEDYYALQAVFAAIDRTDKAYDADPTTAAKRLALEAKRKAAVATIAGIETKAGPELAELDRKLAEGKRTTNGAKRPEYGYHSAIATTPDAAKWVQVDLGASVKLDRVTLRACDDDFNDIGAGFGFPVRFKVETADDAELTRPVIIADQTTKDHANPRTAAVTFAAEGKAGRYVRVTATKLAPRLPTDFIFALAELEAFDLAGKNVALGRGITALDSIEAPVRWRASNLTDGIAPPGPKLSADELAKLTQQRDERLKKSLGDAGTKALAQANADAQSADEGLKKLGPPSRRAYIGTAFSGTGNFIGTGGKPRDIRVLPRGDVTKPGKLVHPGAIAAIGLPFALTPQHTEGDRRAALAKWLTASDNPLTWRSIVNRVWQYHFGRGLVDTPNDFGKMGQPPTHPELLDWLAVEFRDSSGSFKKLHKLIVMSATYCQVSTIDTTMAKVDADNRYLGRQNRRKLEAESVRDSILLAAGKLDLTMGGPSFRDFVIEKPEHSPHYQYQLHEPEDPKSHRRSVYRFTVRSQQEPFLAAFDCADPSLAVEKRNQTLTPQQALALLNNKLTLSMAKHFAARVEKVAMDDRGRVTAAFRLAIGREPTTAEADELAKYAADHGLANACRVILNLNEFVFVD